MGETISTAKGLSIEYDENIACDVCRSPECEDGNEILFCDVCDVAVHQACYGVQKVPIGSWVCKPCAQLLSDCQCLLCSTRGGAMKKTKTKGVEGWVHMSCALWVPEVGIGNVEKMEPVTRIETITPGRWNLVCSICKEKRGACIQCSVKSCVTAFHVTCGFDNNLHMQTVWDDTAPDGVRHVCYCSKHTEKRSGRSPRKASTSSIHSPLKTPQNPSSPRTTPSKSSSSYRVKEEEERENLRQSRLRGMEEEFYKFADVEDLAHELNISKELATVFHRFWTLKRKAREDAALLPPTAEQQERLSGRQIKPFQKATMEIERVVRLRQDLERIRNLCYMVEKREKQKRELTTVREAVFRKELEVVDDNSGKISLEDIRWARSCCVKNFTEYEVLQTLDLKCPARPKIYKKRGRKPKRKQIKNINGFLQTVMNNVSDEITSEHSGECEQTDSGGNNKNALVCSSDVTSDNLADEATIFSVEVGSSSQEDRSSNISDVKADIRSKPPARSWTSNNDDTSSSSDFEDEAARKEKRRASIRNRFQKLPKLDTEVVAVTRTTDAESTGNSPIHSKSSSPLQSKASLNGVHVSACINLQQANADLKGRLSPNIVQDKQFQRNRKRLFCELSGERDDPKSPRLLRSNNLVLGDGMPGDTVSDKKVCRPNGFLEPESEWNDICHLANHCESRSEEDAKFEARLTRSYSRTSEPDSPKSSYGKNDVVRNVDVHPKNERDKAEYCRTRSHTSHSPSIMVSPSSFSAINGVSCGRKNEENKGKNTSLHGDVSEHNGKVFDISSRTRSRSNTMDSLPSWSSPVKKGSRISRSLSTPSTTDLNCKQNGAVAERCRTLRPQTRRSENLDASKVTLRSPTKYSRFFGKLRPAATTSA